MDFSIGDEIRKKVKERGITNITFADKMAMEERNLYHFFKKKEMTIDQLLDASEILDYDFVNLYIKHRHSKSKIHVDMNRDKKTEPKDQISLNISVYGNLEIIKVQFSDFINVVSKEAEMRGLHLG